MQTHGELWLQRAHKRFVGYCKTRGWHCGLPIKVAKDQYQLFIYDRLGKEAALWFEMSADICSLVGENGFIDEPVNALLFDNYMAAWDLAPKYRKLKEQLELALCVS
jgi:hypothetical protein